MKKRLKLLITSVGSFVGSNLLDVLEYQPFRRRERVNLVGTNSIACVPNNFRCDRCYLVPETRSTEFQEKITAIVSIEKPDLVLHGRDSDTDVLATIMESKPDLAQRSASGSIKAIRCAVDKWETSQFALRHDLPFPDSFVVGKTGSISALEKFSRKVGYPMIGKPVEGYASKGVYFVRNFDEAETLAAYGNYIFQEYLGDAKTLDTYFDTFQAGIPLFSNAPNIFHHSCHIIISPHGRFSDVFVTKNIHEAGVTVGMSKVAEPKLEELATSYAKAIYKEGGYGPFTIQFRKDKFGAWKAQEVNLRTNGNTFPRFLMGQDDLGIIVNNMLPDADFPIYGGLNKAEHYSIGKIPHCHMMHHDDVNSLESSLVWNSIASD
jgi:carbamoyl-phosphate synthase large subunit